jgi:ribosome-binding protein aMBF1 (putative translation factor)
MIFKKVIKKPRKSYRCSVCGHEITGEHIYSWCTDVCGSPMGVRVCLKCSVSERMSDDFRNFAKQNLSPTLFKD